MSWLKSLNIADWFSIYRIIAAPVLLILIGFGEKEIFTWMLLISYITDGVDGFVARALNISSARGAQLDSYGDQMTLIVALIGLLVFENAFINENYQLILIAFVPYIIQMVIAFRKYGRATAFHTYLAKLSAIVQAVFILWLLFFGPVYPLFYLMIILGVIETIEEIALIFMYDNWVEGVKGIFWAMRDKRRAKKHA
ncbi:MAG: CDP-alcohol phosphatidyltransferase family protein [Bacteroidia bacterium]|nr:CDP-alcohol phosphatidyltransferase family protein [Bacteroidia bacterium]